MNLDKLWKFLTVLAVGVILAVCGIPRLAAQHAVTLDKDSLRSCLSPDQYKVLVQSGTERAFTSPLNYEKRDGAYISPVTKDTLFLSNDKFNSGTGWPSFDQATDKVAVRKENDGTGRWEVIEKSTGLHLGHVFYNEGFTKENARYCINGLAIDFLPEGGNDNDR